MNILELENAFPTSHFHFNEAAEWLEKVVYLKNLGIFGIVEEIRYTDLGYDLLIVCPKFSLNFSKEEFIQEVELKLDQLQLPVLH